MDYNFTYQTIWTLMVTTMLIGDVIRMIEDLLVGIAST